jgi:hypothetical protein
METPRGTVAVAYERSEAGVRFNIRIPEGCTAKFSYGGIERALCAGENELFVEAQG